MKGLASLGWVEEQNPPFTFSHQFGGLSGYFVALSFCANVVEAINGVCFIWLYLADWR